MDQGLSEFTEALASTAPTPGGGGAAALMGALSASLGAMAARLSAGKHTDAERAQALEALAENCDKLRARFLEQIEADAAAFLPLSQAYRLPKNDPMREETLLRASFGACSAAIEMLSLCARTADALTELRQCASRLMLSDVGCAAAACRAALLCAAMNVFVNTRSYSEEPEAAALNRTAEAVLQDSLPKLEEIELQVLLQLRNEEI